VSLFRFIALILFLSPSWPFFLNDSCKLDITWKHSLHSFGHCRSNTRLSHISNKIWIKWVKVSFVSKIQFFLICNSQRWFHWVHPRNRNNYPCPLCSKNSLPCGSCCSNYSKSFIGSREDHCMGSKSWRSMCLNLKMRNLPWT